jgi:hypothetical protein
MAPNYLPFNRKERYFTGTVLPFVVASGDFAHLDVLLELCGLPGVLPESKEERLETVQFLTEYGFAESVGFDEAWRPYPGGKDTPDVVIRGVGWLLAIEAKLYTQQGKAAIEKQVGEQAKLVRTWARALDVPPDRAKVVVLLPQAYATKVGELPWPTITWEQVRDLYADAAPTYWLGVLSEAIERYPDLVSKVVSNAEGHLTGQEIVDGHLAGDFEFKWVGRQGGPAGKLWASDLADQSWRTTTYQVRSAPLVATNWWRIADFVAAAERTVD